MLFFFHLTFYLFIAWHHYKSLDYTIYSNPYPKKKKKRIPPTTVASTKIILDENSNPWCTSHSLNGQTLSSLFFFLPFVLSGTSNTLQKSQSQYPTPPPPSDHTSRHLPFPTFQWAPHPREPSFDPHTHAQHTNNTQPIYI